MWQFLAGLGTGAVGVLAIAPRFQFLGFNINIACERALQTIAERTYISQELGALMVMAATVVLVTFALAWGRRRNSN